MNVINKSLYQKFAKILFFLLANTLNLHAKLRLKAILIQRSVFKISEIYEDEQLDSAQRYFIEVIKV